MNICKIGEKKEIGGKWYEKQEAPVRGYCHGCHIGSAHTSCPIYKTAEMTREPIENGGSECNGTIWVSCPAPKPTKKPAPAKWTMIPTDTKLTKAKVIEMANKLGAENARLKARLAKEVG